jgi:hypothetical protein
MKVYFAMLSADGGNPSWSAMFTTLIITTGTVLIMGGGLYLIYSLWRLVLQLVSNADSELISAIKGLLGGVEITVPQKFTAIGAGLLGTILILVFCVAAIVWGLRFTYN